MILGPVFWMELRTSARRARHYATRVFFVSLILVIILVAWDAFVSSRRGRTALTPHELPMLGRRIFTAYAMTQFLVLLFIAPLYSGGAVASDRERRVLELVFTTDLRNIELVASKFLVRVIHSWMLAAAGLPVMWLCLLLGGVAAVDIAATLSLTVSVTVFVASLGLFVSIGARRAYSAIALTYLLLLVAWVAAPFIAGYLLATGAAKGLGSLAAASMLATNPVLAMADTVMDSGMPVIGSISPWQCSAFYGVAALLMIVTCMLLIRRLGLWASRERVPRQSKRAHGRPGRARRVWANPVAWREVRTIAVHRRIRWVRIGCLVFSIMISAIVWVGWIADWIDGQQALTVDAEGVCAVTTCTAIVAWILMSLQGAVCFSHEREHHTIDALLTTPLDGLQIVLGKLQGVLHNSLFALSFPIGFALLACGQGVTSLRATALAIGIVLAAGLFAACLGLAASVWLGSSGKACGVAAGTLLALCVAMPLINFMFFETRNSHALAHVSPTTNLSWGIFDESARNNRQDYRRGLRDYRIWPDRLHMSLNHLGGELFLAFLLGALSVHHVENSSRVRQQRGATSFWPTRAGRREPDSFASRSLPESERCQTPLEL